MLNRAMLNLNYFRSLWLLFITCLFLYPSLSAANVLKSIRIWPSPEDTRVVIDLASEANFSYFSLSKPSRLVVDLNQTTAHAKLPIISKKSPVLARIRKSTPPNSHAFRLVFELKESAKAQLFKLKPTPGGRYGHRLVIDFSHKHIAKKAVVAKKTVTKKATTTYAKPKRDILIIIDPGHGGEDPGSIGPSRRYEKNATLGIARRLAQKLAAVPGIKTKMTRNGDYFVNLNRRVAIARENNAHLFISIHADAFTSPQPRGASVFVLNTRRANSEIARWVENHERQSEILGGSGTAFASKTKDKNVNQTLLDLQFSHSQKEGYTLATDILSEVGKVARLHHSRPINTSLAVLRSPQIPSVLVETGFISNPVEEKQLFQRTHQEKLATSITKAVVKYLKDNPPEGTVYSPSVKSVTYRVVSGDSLSKIAQRYGMTTTQLMKANHLKSHHISVGQHLTILGYSEPIQHRSTASSSSHQPRHVTSHKVVHKPVHKTTHRAASTVRHITITHTIRSGEFLSKIAAHYNVSVAKIKQQNHLRSDKVRIGQRLKITVNTQHASVRKHKVTRGEFLSRIAGKYGVSVKRIRQANHLRSDKLAVGQILVIPE